MHFVAWIPFLILCKFYVAAESRKGDCIFGGQVFKDTQIWLHQSFFNVTCAGGIIKVGTFIFNLSTLEFIKSNAILGDQLRDEPRNAAGARNSKLLRGRIQLQMQIEG